MKKGLSSRRSTGPPAKRNRRPVQEIDHIRRILSLVPDCDSRKVQSVKQRIIAGSYQIDCELVAEKILVDNFFSQYFLSEFY
jgi:anti-sigma28 factor (negative regulator of flagellin synthesis)